MPRGTIVTANDERGFCFILEDKGPELFARRSEFSNPNVSFRNIAGARCEFSVGESNRGFECRNVEIIEDPAGREHGTINRMVRSGGGFIQGYGAPDRGIFFSELALVGDGWPDDPKGIDVSYTRSTDKQGRLTAVAIRRCSTDVSAQGRA